LSRGLRLTGLCYWLSPRAVYSKPFSSRQLLIPASVVGNPVYLPRLICSILSTGLWAGSALIAGGGPSIHLTKRTMLSLCQRWLARSPKALFAQKFRKRLHKSSITTDVSAKADWRPQTYIAVPSNVHDKLTYRWKLRDFIAAGPITFEATLHMTMEGFDVVTYGRMKLRGWPH
jgi:hypothetical protein